VVRWASHGSSILEIGAGTGGNLCLLRRYGKVKAVEPDSLARQIAVNKTGIAVESGYLPSGIPNHLGKFDLVCLFDVLEHIKADIQSLMAIRPFLYPGGRVLVTIPAHNWLWSTHDEIHHHVRRYSKNSLRSAATAAGYSIVKLFYFNSLLFPLAVLIRTIDPALAKRRPSGVCLPAAILNKALSAVVRFEAGLWPWIPLPVGLSLVAVIEPR
jgi:SAM-dependent methyltransferase